MMLPDKLQVQLGTRHFSGNLRSLKRTEALVDFSSNDYLGFSKKLAQSSAHLSGATGSRLVTGHSKTYEQLEKKIAQFHQVENALIFNSGYDANIGLISCIADRMDLILYDQFVHASLRDGIRLSNAKALKFHHNDFDHLEILLSKFSQAENRQVYVLTESVFSMDGDQPDLKVLVDLISSYDNVHLILDEAHALGVLGNKGEGLAQQFHLQDKIFARIVTFGKAMGCHGAAVLGSSELKEYLVNFARSLIYTTALPEHALLAIDQAYSLLEQDQQSIDKLQHNIRTFNKLVIQAGLRLRFRESETAIQACVVKGNDQVKQLAHILQKEAYDIRPILSPTVPPGTERLRICLHAYNNEAEMRHVLDLIATNLKTL